MSIVFHDSEGGAVIDTTRSYPRTADGNCGAFRRARYADSITVPSDPIYQRPSPHIVSRRDFWLGIGIAAVIGCAGAAWIFFGLSAR